ncbi:MAG: aminopeptidase [Spirochaetaceae bacterium]|jgi:predicted aminopeptidase|nr:aminopeptidase [Spirochaetaceae bacterium]
MVKFLPVIFSSVILLALAFVFPCCYTLKQGGIMLGYLGSAVPVENLVKKDPSNEKIREFVDNIADIRRFSIEVLGLKNTKNYTKYVVLDRDYLAAIVSAADKYSFQRYQWTFPVVGKVPYKGFFVPQDARKEAEKLEKKDLDVWIRKVTAFSTLGFFRDPLYSYMIDYPIDEIANLIIHESLHATVFVAGNMDFNEELAEIIGNEGSKLYIETRFGANSEERQAMYERQKDSETFVRLIQDLISQLEQVYNSDITKEEMLLRKETTISSFMLQFADHYDENFSTENLRHFPALSINNAFLDLYRLYHKKESRLEQLYLGSGSDISKFISAAKQIKGTKDPTAQLEKALQSSM